ncbi:MAG: methylmalonyl Co-A mutase-associated GTPase MeaB [Alphaproteobacteria bacterium]|nr:methylmalonyl Co-A mutase-associated GTPase MeaB [Alphaproteobacteria bacterium]
MTLDDLQAGGKAALAKALAQLERAPDAAETLALLDAAYAVPQAHIIGMTGPPGAGKSTLTGVLLKRYRAAGRRVGVIAVDPSSRRSGGALLGDRTRLRTDPEDQGVFVRSMAARDRLGGLAADTVKARTLLAALFDVVLIETVGVGQSETDVEGAVDTVLFCVQPGAGDSLQFMKAGIAEIPDVVCVTKADMGAVVRRTVIDAKGALSLNERIEDWRPPVLSASAETGEGVEALIDALDDHWGWLCAGDRLARRRNDQARGWLADMVRERWGREGLKKALPLVLAEGRSPFSEIDRLQSLFVSWER